MSEEKEIKTVKHLEQYLNFADKAAIARKVGVTSPTITRFFAGVKGKFYTPILVEVIKVAKANKLAEKDLKEHAAA